MADPNDAAEHGSPGVNRRSYLKLASAAGLAVGTTSLLGGTAAAATVDLGDEGLEDGDEIDGYLEDHFQSGNEVHVPPGDYDWNGGGLGGDYSNAALIGDGEPGAVRFHHPEGEYRYNAVRAQSGEVRLENITIRGATGGEEAKLRAEARDEDARMVLDKVWLPDGVVDGDDAVGLYVGADHAGTIEFIDCYVEGFSDNGLYASGPGAGFDDAEDGRVIVEGGLYKNNNISNLRLGSSNSVAREVTLVHDGPSPPNDGVWNQRNLRIRQPGENIVVEDCDIYHSVDSYYPVDMSSQFSGGSGVIRNTRIYTNSSSMAIGNHGDGWSAENVHLTGDGSFDIGIEATGTVTGSDAQQATDKPRIPIHTYAGRDGETTSSDGGDDLPDMDPHLVSFVSTEDAGEATYEFAADGPVVPVSDSPYSSPSGNEVRATSNFTVEAGDDGVHNVSGYTGNGYGDAYEVYGQVTDVTVDNADWMWIELDGSEVSEDELVAQTAADDGGDADDGLPNAIVIDGSDTDSSSTYSFEVSGEIRQSEELTSTPSNASAWDSLASNVSNGKVLGIVRDGVDGYRYSGTVTSMQVCGDATVEFETQE
ncbi:hypothetical protein SAMN06269185_2826 [Natronoarchaeum philippinense]|uniref:Right handed beta helix region n=1 Tax=Natronoarchaeum philippinense TaxID=558529 RepID=A0A285P6Z2_NATPI|nr:hypothetical protein [Natronoarchaeum philippinense]SNZ16953.1 hypothetical protein SAMN06269185_2826 [Natronoarchaeum philippinense]